MTMRQQQDVNSAANSEEQEETISCFFVTFVENS